MSEVRSRINSLRAKCFHAGVSWTSDGVRMLWCNGGIPIPLVPSHKRWRYCDLPAGLTQRGTGATERTSPCQLQSSKHLQANGFTTPSLFALKRTVTAWLKCNLRSAMDEYWSAKLT
ncbi:hypothetical protein IG631_01317 [Alternaria alternata]|nr:hypothetical protein IG631_01317 [Alternaria alternata]